MNTNFPFAIRDLQPSEYPFLREMFYTALHVRPGIKPPPKSIIDEPALAKYIAYWGQRPDDIALVGTTKDQLAGAIWCRVLKKTEKGYGYIDDYTPELSMAIKPPFRNKGLGGRLLSAAFDALNQKGFLQVSLSVDQDNQAIRLYQRFGFKIVSEEGTAFTMKKIL